MALRALEMLMDLSTPVGAYLMISGGPGAATIQICTRTLLYINSI